MDSIINNFARVAASALREIERFDTNTWCVIAVATVSFGYFMLRGNLRS